MTTCLLVAAVITCLNVAPLSPQEAARVLTASVPAFVPPFMLVVPPGPSSYVPPMEIRPASRIEPLSRQWTSVTTYLPRFGPPITVFDGRHVSRTGLQRIPRFVR